MSDQITVPLGLGRVFEIKTVSHGFWIGLHKRDNATLEHIHYPQDVLMSLSGFLEFFHWHGVNRNRRLVERHYYGLGFGICTFAPVPAAPPTTADRPVLMTRVPYWAFYLTFLWTACRLLPSPSWRIRKKGHQAISD